MAGYFGSKGTNLNVERNYNQLIERCAPYARLAANSPIDPGMALPTFLVYESVGNSSYNGLWVTANKQLARACSSTFRTRGRNRLTRIRATTRGWCMQDSFNVRGDRGIVGFRRAAAHRDRRRLRFAVQRQPAERRLGISSIEQTQSGNPINFRTTNAAFTGSALLRPNVMLRCLRDSRPATNGSATTVTYIQNPNVFVNPGNAFGTLGRNVVIGPGFSNLDLALVKNTRITER